MQDFAKDPEISEVPEGIRSSEKMSFPELDPSNVREKMVGGETFVVNIVTDWCPDCTVHQRPNLGRFIDQLGGAGIPFFELRVQEVRGQFVSPEHESITSDFGGPGYPRTILITDGKVRDGDNLEVTSSDDLDALTEKFIKLVSAGSE